MCIAFVAWRVEGRYELVLASNRDEFYERPTQNCHWWEDNSNILAGLDLQEGRADNGTWMGITKQGRVAVLTNVRTPLGGESPRSRGELVRDFLMDPTITPWDYCEKVAKQMDEYGGFNILTFDISNRKAPPVYLTNLGPSKGVVLGVPAGIHGLSNAALNSPWFKVERGKSRLAQYDLTLTPEQLLPQLFELLSDRQKAPLSELPDTGMGDKIEHHLSSTMIDIGPEHKVPIIGHGYGTRAQSVILIDREGNAKVVERARQADGSWQEQTFDFDICEGPDDPDKDK